MLDAKYCLAQLCRQCRVDRQARREATWRHELAFGECLSQLLPPSFQSIILLSTEFQVVLPNWEETILNSWECIPLCSRHQHCPTVIHHSMCSHVMLVLHYLYVFTTKYHRSRSRSNIERPYARCQKNKERLCVCVTQSRPWVEFLVDCRGAHRSNTNFILAASINHARAGEDRHALLKCTLRQWSSLRRHLHCCGVS